MKLETPVSAQIDLSATITSLSDRERIAWITALLETIGEEGAIDAIRALINEPRWNDQEPT